MSKFVNGLITGGVAAAAGAYYLVKNKDKGRHMIRESREVLDKAEKCLDKAEQKVFYRSKKMAAEKKTAAPNTY